MNLGIVCRMVGIVAMLTGVFMIFSLPWALPVLGQHTLLEPDAIEVETQGLNALLVSVLISLAVGGLLYWRGRNERQSKLFRREAMAVVGLSWVLATVLGALPYYLCGVQRSPMLRAFDENTPLLIAEEQWSFFRSYHTAPLVTRAEFKVLQPLIAAGARGLSEQQLCAAAEMADAATVFLKLAERPPWRDVLIGPDNSSELAYADRALNYRVRWVRMSFWDCLFESQSGFSTTGATVISDLEDSVLVPHCILFWRSSTHFLGGLGIIVLFVVVLGQGSVGKAMMKAELTGPAKEGPSARIQHTAWLFAALYVALNMLLTLILQLLGMNLFDALCHAFGTMATGGFSNYNLSLGRFDSPAIEYTVTLFMILAGSNFTLLLFALTGNPLRLLRDIEWRVYVSIILASTAIVVGVGMAMQSAGFETVESAIRFGLFQVVSILTTTGYCTADFDQWGHVARGLLLGLMFVGGCAGSTGGGVKVIRVVLLFKILWLELERAFHPRVVRSLHIGGHPLESQQVYRSIPVYIVFVTVIFAGGNLLVTAFEPNSTWGPTVHNKLIDCGSAVIATLNNIGPGVGVVGATQNYSIFCGATKLLMVWLMMLGRLEIFVVLVLFAPGFWRRT